MKSIYSKREWVYNHITPGILVEEALVQRGCGEFKDYKFYVFHDRVKATRIICPMYRRNNEKIYFDRGWQIVKLDLHGEKIPDPIPENLIVIMK